MKPLTLRRASKIVWRVRWRAVAAVMLPVYFLTSLPPSAWAATAGDTFPGPVLTPKDVHVNKHAPVVTPYAGPKIPANPTDSEITYSHAFREPLVPVGGITSPSENQALGAAIKAFLKNKADENIPDLTSFLDQYPNSAWRPSLDLNLAEKFYDTGNFSKALAAWQDAWDRTQNLTDTTGQQVANLAVGKLAEMKARIGRTDELDTLYTQIKGRSVSGVAAQLLYQARAGLWLMHNRPQDAFRCGPSALQELSLATTHKIDHPEIIKQSRSTPQGIALSDVQALAAKIDMPMQMAKRMPGAAFIVPAVIHWKLGHYAALVGKRNGKYIVHDTTFGGAQFLISPQALERETSGYFLVPTGDLPKGWTSVGKDEGSKIMGRGDPLSDDPNCYSPYDSSSGYGDCGSSTGGTGYTVTDLDAAGAGDADSRPNPDAGNSNGNNNADSGQLPPKMTLSSVKAMLVSLNLNDTPVGYKPPIGPTMHFTVQYNQREIAQPSTFTYANLGPNWTFSYVSYVTPNSAYASIYERGGGVETYYNSGTNSYYPAQRSQAVLTEVNLTTWQRTLPGGEIETFGQPDGAGDFFLSKITDPQGNSLTLTYDSNLRLTSLTDAMGQVTTITYGSNTVGYALFYNITQVTDPFGRSAQFAYDGSGRLVKITDVIGITSQFTYSGTSTFVNSLTTPYGVTSFAFGDISTNPTLGTTRWLNTTYPDGNTTRTEYNENEVPSGLQYGYEDAVGVPYVASVPYGMYSGNGINNFMQYRNTYYWNKHAMKSYVGNGNTNDYLNAEVTHWLHTSDINTCSDIQESLKKIDQNRIWFAYAGEISSIQASNTMIAVPTQKGRIFGAGPASATNIQMYQYQYNAIGKVTQQIDPIGRQTKYTYAANNTDLLTVQQLNGSSYDLLATYTYNNQHEVLTATDASGQTTTNTYFPNGEIHTTTNPLSQTTTYAYTNNYLTSVTAPASGATTTYTYDGYGRLRTTTDSQGYITTFNYDVMDRPTYVIYPDGTTSQIIYTNLDAVYAKDRLGRWTHTFYNAIRQPVAVIDSMGNTTTTNWSLSAGPSSIVDPKGNMTQWFYDSQDRLIQKEYPDGHSEYTSYESTTSRVYTTTNANSSVATLSYNLDNTVANVSYNTSAMGDTDVATPTVYYTYYSNYPRIETMADGTGTTTYTYNAVTGSVGSNMLASVQVPVPMNSSPQKYATTYYTSYDQLGRVLSEYVDDTTTGQGFTTNNVSSFTYDSLGRVTNIQNLLTGSGSFHYSYLNNTSRVSSITNTNSGMPSTVYTYQDSTTTPNEPRLSQIQNLNGSGGTISKFNYSYDAQGQITSWTQLTPANTDPQDWAMQYDNEGKLLNVVDTDGSTGVVQHTYGYLYDAAGNRTSAQVDGGSVTSTYNDDNQLTGTSGSGGGSLVFAGTLNKPGTVTVSTTGWTNAAVMSNGQTSFQGTANVTQNMTNSVTVTATNLNGYPTNYTYHVFVPSATGSSYTYDHAGNLTSDGVRSYYYDAKNEMVGIVYNSGNHTDFMYNGSGQRVAIIERPGTTLGSGTPTSVKQYVAGEERDINNHVTKRYYSQGEQRITGSTPTSYFYTRDHLGSIREMLDSSSNVQAEYAYDPYGVPTQVSGSLSCDFQFTGYYYHATSSLFLSATRAYNPNLGRFLQRDPSGEGSGLNLYAYCANNPICGTDSSGLCMDDPFGGAGPLIAFDMMSPMEQDALIDAIISANYGGAFGPTIFTQLTGLPDSVRLNLLFSACVTLGLSLSVATAGSLGALGIGGGAAEGGGVLANQAAGQSVEALARAELEAQGNTIIGSQVTARTSGGIRYIDHLVQTPEGDIFAVEVKSGGAVRNASQLMKDELMFNEGATLGNNAGVLEGQTLKIDTVEMHY